MIYISDKQKLEYLNNPKYNISDKQTFLNMFTESEIENLYFYCIEQRVYVKSIDRTRLNWLKYALARNILFNRLEYIKIIKNDDN